MTKILLCLGFIFVGLAIAQNVHADDSANDKPVTIQKIYDKLVYGDKIPAAQPDRLQESQDMTPEESEAIMLQLAMCWSPPVEATNKENMLVIIDAEFNKDGSYKSIKLSKKMKSRYNSSPLFHKAAETALRAVRVCSPLKNLPPEKFEAWQIMELHFDPKYMLQ